MTARYYPTEGWHLKKRDRGQPCLVNPKGGKIILDETLENVLQTIDGHTFAGINQREIITPGILEVFLKVLVRAGALTKKDDYPTPPTRGGEEEDHEPREAPDGNPLISIVIVNYNGDQHLPGLLDSIERQSYKHHETIVVDNDSGDDSRRYIRAHHRDVRLVELKKNTGFAAAVNTGIAGAGGDYILVLNNDIVLEETALVELVKVALAAGEHWAAAAPKMKFLDNPAFINAIGNSLYPITWGSDNFIGSVDFGQFDHVKETFSACFGAALLNPRVLKQIGPLDHRYKFYYEDADWCFRAQAQGWPVITAPKAVIYHKFGASMNLESRAFKTRYIVGNRLYFTLKNLERRTMKRFLANYLSEDIRSTLFYLKKGNFSMVFAYAGGYLRLLASLPTLFYKRRQLQKKRKITDDRLIFAKAAPSNPALMEDGSPKLDIHSLHTNYAFLKGPQITQINTD